MHNIEKNLDQVIQQINQACLQHERDPHQVILLAVSKTKSVADIEAAYVHGQRDFGESYLQEAEQKILQLQDRAITWHYIGPIQSNKTRRISELFDWVHSVDRLKIAQRLDQSRPADKAPLNVLLQVNIDADPNKSGIPDSDILQLAEQVSQLPRLKLRGLMAIPSIHEDLASQRKPFAQMQQAMMKLQQQHPDCDTLSMGMTGDMQAAIAEGSTLVRIGTAIFGARTR